MNKIFKSVWVLLLSIICTLSCAPKTIDPGEDVIHVSEVSLDKTKVGLDLQVAKKTQLKATVLPEGASDKSVSWKSSKSNIAKVEDGLVTALSVGTTTITVTSNDGGKTAECEVVVDADLQISIKELPDLNQGKISPNLIINGNEHFVILGGHTGGFSRALAVEEYKDGVWRNIGSVFHDLAFQVTLKDGRTMIGGGCERNGGSGYIKDVIIYNPADGKLYSTGAMTRGRTMPRAGLLKSGKVLVGGAWYNDFGRDLDLYDPETGEFSLLQDALPRDYAAPFILPTEDGGAVILGAGTSRADLHPCDGKVFKYKATDNTVETIENDIFTKHYIDATFENAANMVENWIYDGKYIFMAKDEKFKKNFTLITFDPVTEKFEVVVDLPTKAHYTNDIFVNQEMGLLYIFSTDSNGVPELHILNPKGEILKSFVLSGKRMNSFGARMLPNGNILIVGGSADGTSDSPLKNAYIVEIFK